MTAPVLQVIIGSTRPGRVGLPVGEWFLALARATGRFEVERVDLAEVNLPLLDEPRPPRLGQYEHDHTRRWSETVSRGDAFVFVVPEYNHGMNAATKNAIDYLSREWRRKPVSFVSYGGVAAGTRSAQQFKQVAASLGMVIAVASVPIPNVRERVVDGVFRSDEALDALAERMLDELAELTELVRTRAQ